MRFDLSAMAKRATNRRRAQIALRPIVPTAALAADLYAVYRPIILAWQRGIERIAARYEVALPVRDTLHDSIFDLESILATIEGELQRLVLAITPALRDWVVRAEKIHRQRWRGAVLTATGIDLATMLGRGDVSDTLEGFMARNVSLIRSVSDDTRAKVSDIVLRGYQARSPIAMIAKEMREAVGMSRKRAIRVAADQSSKLAARLDQARQEQAGIASFKWRHSMKRHPRKTHVEHDGRVYRWDALPLLEGKPDRPGDAPFCGCRAQAVVDLG